jgi:Holliday junction resolvase RusA-like endonuclease
MNYTLNIKPLSVNAAFRGKKFRTDLYNDFILKMHFILPNEIEIPDRKNVKIAIEFGFSSKLSDIDNCIKSFLDCLVKKYGVDDRNIYEMHVFKAIVAKGKEHIKFKIY